MQLIATIAHSGIVKGRVKTLITLIPGIVLG
jgi:hypothetical protein